jgi:hypothetical protein
MLASAICAISLVAVTHTQEKGYYSIHAHQSV